MSAWSVSSLKITIPVEAGNTAIKNGSLAQIIGGVLEQIKAEAAYFGASDGLRSGYIGFDLKSPADGLRTGSDRVWRIGSPPGD